MSSASAERLYFHSAAGAHVFLADGSRIYDLDAETMEALDAAGPDAGESLLRSLGIMNESARFIDDRAPPLPALHALSLTVAQACNMGCGYCYADEGRFGGAARMMSLATAIAGVDRLIAESAPGSDIVLGFMGGEPLLNRAVVHAAAHYAEKAAASAGRRIRFSLTTNGTLITPQDAELFAAHRFYVAVSIDGDRAGNDRQRPMHDGGGSYDRIVDGLATLERHGRPHHLSARVTVTPRTGALAPALDHIIQLGFDSVGFAAVLTSPDPTLAFNAADFDRFLDEMIACGRIALPRLLAGESYPFSNFETALHEIHRGSHRPYPCGAGAAYLSASAEGGLYACHRLVAAPEFAMGDLKTGSDRALRSAHLERSHVDRMSPCKDCWARYLCGGGCYHEVAKRGRIGCDYIRGWLAFCLRSYAELSAARPEYFAAAPSAAAAGLRANTLAE
jgi:uncharacterized protein